jgi:hypothetical protein
MHFLTFTTMPEETALATHDVVASGYRAISRPLFAVPEKSLFK